MPTSDNTEIAALHRRYMDLTGYALRLDMARENAWGLWLHYAREAIRCVEAPAGYSPAQALDDVVGWLRGEIRAQRRNVGSLRFSNLVGQPDRFEEDLSMMLAQRRAADRRPPPNRASVLRATGRPEQEEPPPAAPAAEAIERMLSQLRAAAVGGSRREHEPPKE